MNNSQNQSSKKFISFPGKIHFINTDQDLKPLISRIENFKELGFDTETRPSFKKGETYKVALLQLSSETDAFIFRLHNMTDYSPIREILESPEVLKVGVAIRDDIKQLQKRFSFTPRNFQELQDLAKAKGLKNFGLKGMAEEVLSEKLSKGPKLTNWEVHPLSAQQLMYAATDAWIGLTLYQKLRLDSE